VSYKDNVHSINLDRYRGNILLQEIGMDGQKKLFDKSVCIVGVGATGCMTAINLTRAGVGKLRIIDRDVIDATNLQRQILYNENDVGKMKANVAERKLMDTNSSIKIEGLVEHLDGENISEIMENSDLILDCTDNFETRYLINDFAVKEEKPWIYCGAIATCGMVMFISPYRTACFKCLVPKIPNKVETCDTDGILNTVPLILASIQSTMAIKYLLDNCFEEYLIIYDGWSNDFDKIKIQRDKNCICCGQKEFSSFEKRKEYRKLCGEDAILITGGDKVNFELLKKRLEKKGKINITEFMFKFKTDTFEISIFTSGVTIIYGVDNRKTAESIYKKYVES